jgi:hypothetical protein
MSDLTRAVRINREIKYIIGASRQVNLVAINALLTSRQAGKRSLGFAVVSRELRMLASSLESLMEGLDKVISSLAGHLAENLRTSRILAYIDKTLDSTDEPHAALQSARSSLAGKNNRFGTAIAHDWLLLGQHVQQALRLTEMGGALSRSAKIEAAYGGDMARVLTQVADQVEETVGEIVQRLRNIRVLISE